MKKILRFLGMVLAVGGTLAACRPPAEQNYGVNTTSASHTVEHRDLRVLVFADPHLDPFRDKALAQSLAAAPVSRWPTILSAATGQAVPSVGRDANPALLISALTEMHAAVPDPDVIFVAGDLLAHDFHRHFVDTFDVSDDASYHSFVDKTAEITPVVLHALYPHAQILPTVGNNDGYCGDYRTTPRDQFLAHESHIWEPLVNRDNRAPNFAHTYGVGGFYASLLPNGVRVIGLNSVLFSSAYENACGDPDDHPADEELTWLQQRLEEPHAPPTVILTHIPPGIDAFKSFLHLGKPSEFYNADVQARFLSLVAAPDAHVSTIVTGHLHNIGYRLIAHGGINNEGIPVYSAPSLSPIFGNAPGFVEFELSSDGRIDNLTAYELQTHLPGMHGHPVWQRAYDVRQRYGIDGITASSLRKLHALEQQNTSLRATFESDRVGGGPAAAIGSFSWRTAWCSETALDSRSYLACEGVPKIPGMFGN